MSKTRNTPCLVDLGELQSRISFAWVHIGSCTKLDFVVGEGSHVIELQVTVTYIKSTNSK